LGEATADVKIDPLPFSPAWGHLDIPCCDGCAKHVRWHRDGGGFLSVTLLSILVGFGVFWLLASANGERMWWHGSDGFREGVVMMAGGAAAGGLFFWWRRKRALPALEPEHASLDLPIEFEVRGDETRLRVGNHRYAGLLEEANHPALLEIRPPNRDKSLALVGFAVFVLFFAPWWVSLTEYSGWTKKRVDSVFWSLFVLLLLSFPIGGRILAAVRSGDRGVAVLWASVLALGACIVMFVAMRVAVGTALR
jgi:hypothetical protein